MSRIQTPPTADVGVLPFEEARHLVEQHAERQAKHVNQTDLETVDLSAASGRILAEAIIADRDFPPFARATRDGYAVRAADVAKVPARLEVIGELKAGDAADRYSIAPAQAIAIMTGAPLPKGAEAVVMVEHTSEIRDLKTSNAGKSPQLIPKRIDVHRSVNPGDNFVPRAAEASEGQPLLQRGHRLDYPAIAIAASVGKSKVKVFRKPRVGVLSTGNEVVDINATPGAAQIRNSNSYSLAAQIHSAGGEPVQLPIVPDELVQLRALIEQGLSCDLLLLTGGVSMGKYDLVEQVLGELKAEFYFTGAQIQPGRPVVFGACTDASGGAGAPARLPAADSLSKHTAPASPKKYFFGLPGNPVSTMVTFELFARPMIEALSGMTPRPLIFLSAKLKSEIRTKTGLKRFLPAVLTGEFERAEVELTRWQGSGDIAAMARSNCYVVIPPDRERIDAGESVSLLMR